MKAKGIFFDLLGTLLISQDSKTARHKWYNAIYLNIKSCGIDIDRKQLEEMLDGFLEPRVPIKTGSPSGITRYEKRLVNLFAEHKMDVPLDIISKIADDSCKAWSSEFIFDNDVIPVLKHFSKTKKTALVSNFDHPRFVTDLFASHDMNRFFDCITISGEIDLHKPDPQIFYHTMEKLNLNPEEVVHVGDTSDDTDGAAAAGITPILIDRNYAESGLQVDYSKNTENNKIHFDAEIKIKKLSELIEMIE